VTEGNTGTRAATFTVTLSAASAQAITVAYSTGNGSATAGSDYQAASGTVTFAPGETTKTITVPVIGDRLAEPTETFVVTLSDPVNAVVADGRGVGTVADDEPRISINDVARGEGKSRTTAFTFTVTLSAAYDQAVTVSYRTVDGTAKAGEDYTAMTGTVTFAPGETQKTITITVTGDKKEESDETFYLDLFGNSGNSLFTKNRGLGTILNDD
jgi:chitinase